MPYWLLCTLAVIGCYAILKWAYSWFVHLFIDDGKGELRAIQARVEEAAARIDTMSEQELAEFNYYNRILEHYKDYI